MLDLAAVGTLMGWCTGITTGRICQEQRSRPAISHIHIASSRLLLLLLYTGAILYLMARTWGLARDP